jgi:2-polyprenyl-6-methoxyphenol hydroxylase-like FAD-dependent oxidoreductase
MSPAGGNGINYAIMDAVAAANLLSAPLQMGHVSVDDLARVQRRRELPTRIIQAVINVVQARLIKAGLDPNVSFTPLPGFLRWPLLRNLPPRLLGFGILPEHVRNETSRDQIWSQVGKWVGGMLVVLAGIQLIRRFIRRF